jgi:hypothetical protein
LKNSTTFLKVKKHVLKQDNSKGSLHKQSLAN